MLRVDVCEFFSAQGEKAMDRREFSKRSLLLGLGAAAGLTGNGVLRAQEAETAEFYTEPPKKLPVRKCDVVVAGGGTAGVVAALAAARTGAKTILVERKGYTGGTVTEGGTALHSFFNLWKAFPGVKKRQVVRGIPSEIVDELIKIGGCSGHAEMERRYDYDSVCTAIDTELYKLITMRMLAEAGVTMYLNTFLAGAIVKDGRVQGVIVESHGGREAVMASAFVDCTAYGDLAAAAGAEYEEPNDYAVCNSFGMANVDIERYYNFLKEREAVGELAWGMRDGKDHQIVRLSGHATKISDEFAAGAREIGMSMVTTTVHDNYFMFIKINMKLPASPTDRDTVSQAELTLRERQYRAIQLFRKYVPGCENAFIARTSPGLNIRRARHIICDYDITHEDVIEGRHFEDDVFVYGFHDYAPRYQVANGGTYGIPYRALCVKGLDNLLVAGMMITGDHRAHMSTRNTVSCMGQGQATGTAAALCAAGRCGTRELPYGVLRDALTRGGVYFET